MSRLSLFLLGPPRIERDGVPVHVRGCPHRLPGSDRTESGEVLASKRKTCYNSPTNALPKENKGNDTPIH
jgi:hypothetical protein